MRLLEERRNTYVGTSIRHREHEEPLEGRALYTGDHTPKNCLYAAIYRSPYAHAEILKVDLSKARDLPGVVAAFSSKDLPDWVLPMATFPFQSRNPFKVGNPLIKFFDHYCLARDRARFAGEAIAVVVADDRYVAEDAIELIEADYEPLEVVLDAEEAARPDATLLYPEWGDNVALSFHVEAGNVDAAFATADVIVKETVKSHRFTGTPLEPRVVIAEYDPAEKMLTLNDSTQIPHNIAMMLEVSLDVPHLKVRVVNNRVGGGFGQKWGHYPEEQLIGALAIALERPVKWVETRREHMVATVHAREQTHHVEMAFTKDGEILALRDTIYASLGVMYPLGGAAVMVTTPMFVPGAYTIRNYAAQLYGIATNKTPFGAHRGFGKAEAAYVIERMMDIAAQRLGIAPELLRERNFIPPEAFPYMSATGNRYDSGQYAKALRRALELADYESVKKDQPILRAAGRLIGIGMALTIEPSSSTRMGSFNAGYYSVAMRLDPTGRVFVFTGGSDEGQNHASAIAQLTAEELGCALDDVFTLEGDSLRCPIGSGSYSSRFSVVGMSAVTMAARQIADKARAIAAHLWSSHPENIVMRDGKIMTADGKDSMSLQMLARTAYLRIHDLPDGMEPGLDVIYHYRDANISFQADEQGRVQMFSSFPYAADVAVVEIDPKTGFVTVLKYVSVHDCGNMLDPANAEAQHVGALAHGIGGALFEELRYDESGILLNGSFADYLVPTAVEMPNLTLDSVVSPNPFTPGGFKGAGETGTVSPPPCLANAVEDALRHLGAKVRRTPLAPEYLWRLIREAQEKVSA
jgi:aerobic carbon-monoxide dehydrogenase large subunit